MQNFGIWATLYGLNLAKNLNGLKKKFGWARFGPKQLNGAHGAWRGGSGPQNKTQLIIGSGPGHGSWPVGWVQICKNLARTRLIAIPTSPNLAFKFSTQIH